MSASQTTEAAAATLRVSIQLGAGSAIAKLDTTAMDSPAEVSQNNGSKLTVRVRLLSDAKLPGICSIRQMGSYSV